jgi:hypothetical protein
MDPRHGVHPSIPFAAITVAVIAFGLFNVQTDSMIGGLAAIALHLSILSPLLWAGRLHLGASRFGIVVYALWAFSATSAGVGVLQVMFPGRFDPTASSTVQEFESEGTTLNVTLADGTIIYRPFGLTDQPGGAATAGVAAYVFGLGLLVSSRKMLMRAAYLAGMGTGLFIIYLTQVRASLVMCAIATITFVVIMSMRGEFKRLSGSLAALSAVVIVSTFLAILVGGSSMMDRVFTLVNDDAGEVYYSNRGKFLDYTFSVALPSYPFGAGLGRYGMMNRYFGRDKGNGYGVLWAEIQWTAWVYDGGWVMVIVYPLAILMAMWTSLKIGLDRFNGAMGLWGAILFAYNMAALAILFSYPLFMSQSGLEFWVLNGLLFAAAQVYGRSLRAVVPVGFEQVPLLWRPGAGNPGGGNPAVAPRAVADESNGSSPGRRALSNRPAPAVVPVFAQTPPRNASQPTNHPAR